MNIFKKSSSLIKCKLLILSAICSAFTFVPNNVFAKDLTYNYIEDEKENEEFEVESEKTSKKENKKNFKKTEKKGEIKNKKQNANKKKSSYKIENLKKPSLKYIEEKNLSTKKLLINLIKKGFKEEDIVKFYFEIPEENLGKMIGNDWIAKDKNSDNFKMEKAEKKSLQKIIKRIKKLEIKSLYKKIPVPKDKNKNIVILTPGFGFEDAGATRAYGNKQIKSANLNAYMVYYLTKNLLKQGFEVYIPCDLSYAGLSLPKNESLHVIFEKRPPIMGLGDKYRMADAYHIIIKEIFKKLIDDYDERNKKPKMASVCIHHNSNPDGSVFGFIPFYENTEKTSEKFTKLSKKLANIFNKYGTGITPDKKGINRGEVTEEDWVFCHFGDVNEKEVKEFDSQAAVMLEREYISNRTQLKKLLKVGYMKQSAINFTKALCEYFGKEYKKTDEDKKVADIVKKLKQMEKNKEKEDTQKNKKEINKTQKTDKKAKNKNEKSEKKEKNKKMITKKKSNKKENSNKKKEIDIKNKKETKKD